MRPYQYVILILFCFAVAVLAFDYIELKYQVRHNTEARQAPLNIHVTGPYTTVIKTPSEVLLGEGD